MEREGLLAALAALPDEEFQHLAFVCHDIAKRLPHQKFDDVGKTARAALGIPEPEPAPEPATAAPSDNDVMVRLDGGVSAAAEEGKF